MNILNNSVYFLYDIIIYYFPKGLPVKKFGVYPRTFLLLILQIC
ncbi:hypothetical protein KIS4809_1841 [Bacillus sp. ZZV12-4809]|nr:hypothetical protein KIS4809_1841 [Bacillus sp. ZZV12-4809]